MKAFVTLAETVVADGAVLSLRERDGQYYLQIGGRGLVSTTASSSETQLADLACAKIERGDATLLIGGLGFGFTVRRVLELVPGVRVQVAELVPEIVAWNREHLQAVNGGLVDDPRVEVLIGDVFAVLSGAANGIYDAVILDVDNGPTALVDPGNRRLYADAGLRLLHHALCRGGRAVFWSAAPDHTFMTRLAAAGFDTATVGAKTHARAKRNTRTLIVADRRG